MTQQSEGKCPFGFGAEDGEKPDTTSYTHAAIAPAMSRDKLPELLKENVTPGEDGLRTGRCLCNAISFKIKTPAEKVFANHDEESRRWTGGVALTVMVRATNTAFSGWGHIVQYAGSDRNRHCFCRLCGTSLFVRHVSPEAMDGMISLSVGCFDNHEGLKLTADTYVDRKPEFYGFEGERRGLTGAEVEAMYAPRPAAE